MNEEKKKQTNKLIRLSLKPPTTSTLKNNHQPQNEELHLQIKL